MERRSFFARLLGFVPAALLSARRPQQSHSDRQHAQLTKILAELKDSRS